MPFPSDVYTVLYDIFGPQGWWPVTRRGKLIPEYRTRVFRRSEKERFEICIGTILTQNTAWKNAEKALCNLHRAGAVDRQVLRRMSHGELARLIQPSGYYNQKAERLKSLAAFFASVTLQSYFTLPLDEVRAELLSVKGIGPETADSMLLYAGNRVTFVVDAYTRRLGQRLGWFGEDGYDGIKAFFEQRLPRSEKVYNEFHALIVRLCKDFCRKTPLCDGCPLSAYCAWHRGL